MVEHTQAVLGRELGAALDRVAAELRGRGRLSVESEPRVLGLFERFGGFVARAFGVASLRAVSVILGIPIVEAARTVIRLRDCSTPHRNV